MSAFSDLRKKLAELFQLDAAAELDFGIYRILNARRVEIEGFLDSLEPQVETILAEALQTGTGELIAELEKVEAGLRAGGFDDAMISTAPKVKELREKIANAGGDPTAITHEIFSLLTTFFGRYYKDGDFLSLRRYKKDTYAIPYEGEEVKLHWANADQYYIKSAETYRDYSFKLGPAPKDEKPDTRPTVTFKLTEADAEKDNNKAVAGQQRRFVYQGVVAESVPTVSVEKSPGNAAETAATHSSRLILAFAHLPIGKAEKQSTLNEAAAATILADHAKGPYTGLAANDPTYTVKSKTRSILAKHLSEYTGKNSFDYFIHKDLGGFLRRELDFFIKNEVVHLDDLDDAPESNWKETRAKIKALRTISGKVIRFLAQIENFQKKLWLKKKFVTACDYVVTLDRVPEELFPEIAACDAQREEWVRLFAIDEIKGDLGRTGYSVPLTVEFLKDNVFLPVATATLPPHLSKELGHLFTSPTSLAICSENSQGLQLIHASVANQIKFCYIDPPYNTGENDFSYKDSFRHSSWLAMIEERLLLGKSFLSLDGQLAASIDDAEIHRLLEIFERVFGDNHLATLVWDRNRKNDAKFFSVGHEYMVVATRDKELLRSNKIEFREPREGLDDAKRLFEKLLKKYQDDWTAIRRDWLAWFDDITVADPRRRMIRFSKVGPRGPFRDDGDISWPGGKGPKYEVLHPATGNVCKVPRGGWVYSTPERFWEEVKTGRVVFGDDESTLPRQARFLFEDAGQVMPSVFYSYAQTATVEFLNLMGSRLFENPKNWRDIARISRYLTESCDTILDFFAGSGTTGHAVINLNREDGGDRKYILIEMGEHFDTVLVPRLKKVIYSKDWKDGKPQSRNTGISHCFKILRLESYEDTLNNLRLHRTREQELALEKFSPEAREDYQLGYMLDLETGGSQSLLNVSAFTDPFDYTLNIATGTAGETKPTEVDLVETFNWLLGLTVLAQGHGGGVTWVESTNPEGEKVLVLWRNTTAVDAEALNTWCKKQKISVLDGEFAVIYVNGDHHLENLRKDDQTWKVRLTDEEFPKLMWEGCE